MYVIPSHTYEIVSWCEADLESWKKIIRTKATKARTHQKKNSSFEPFLLPKNKGGTGITNIHNLHNKNVKPLRNLLHSKQNNSDLRRTIRGTDVY
jgi:hypothetical protein